MRSVLGLIVGLWFAIGAFGAPVPTNVPLTEIRWLSKATTHRLQRPLDASFHLRLDDGVDCTASFISKTGHFVTALHCVAGCLKKSGAVIPELAIDEPTAKMVFPARGDHEEVVKPLYSYKMSIDDQVVERGIQCPGWIGNRHEQIKIVLTGGKGWLTPKNTLTGFAKKFPDEYKALLNDGFEHSGDFAILKAEDLGEHSCLSLSDSAPKSNEPLEAISYACVSRDFMFAFGKTPLYTRGVKTRGLRDSEIYAKAGVKGLGFDPSLVERPETFFSSADIEKCGSGTALFDPNFAIKGIATRVYKESTKYEKGSLEAINSTEIWKSLRRRKSSREVASITNCSNK